MKELDKNYSCSSFTNQDGEGVEALITMGKDKYLFICGNDKLLKRHQISLDVSRLCIQLLRMKLLLISEILN